MKQHNKVDLQFAFETQAQEANALFQRIILAPDDGWSGDATTACF